MFRRKLAPLIKAIAYRLGFRIVVMHRGSDPIRAFKSFLKENRPLRIFDVGANIGQTAALLKKHFPESEVNSFEPTPRTYETLVRNVAKLPGMKTWNVVLGSKVGQERFFVHSDPLLNSILENGSEAYTAVENQITINVTTADRFCEEHGIDRIDLLKVDTQGFEIEVFKGAAELMRNHRIGLIYCEVTFSPLYVKQPTFDELVSFMRDRGFRFVTLFGMDHRDYVCWSDALFVDDKYFETTR